MKKSLIALAVLAASGAAMAQSSVTLYGRIDVEVASKKTTSAAGVTTDPGIKIDSQGLSGGRWGLKGAEDLGGGLKAVFQLEQGFNIDTGTASNSSLQFRRQAFVGFTGGFGTVTMGRQYTPVDNLLGDIDPQGNTVASNYAGVIGKGATGGELGSISAPSTSMDGGRLDNSVFYQSADMSGFTAQAIYGLGENKTATTSATNYFGYGFKYAAGPFAVELAGDQLNAAAGGSTKTWFLGGQYDLQVAKLFVAVNQGTTVTDTKDKGWLLGASVPFAGAYVASGSYARETTKASGASAEAVTKGLGAQVIYNLSKRTNLYGEFRNMTMTAAGASSDSTDKRFGLGLRHSF